MKSNRNWLVPVFAAALVVAGLGLSVPSEAQRQPGKPGKPAKPNVQREFRKNNDGTVRDQKSDALLREARKYCLAALKTMKSALPIYDGHRHMAMALDQLAAKAIGSGLQWDRQHGSNAPMSAQAQANSIKPEKEQDPRRYSDAQIRQSNQRMIEAGKLLDSAKASLQAAAHDYGGYRSQAIQLIEWSQAEIKRGLDWISRRG